MKRINFIITLSVCCVQVISQTKTYNGSFNTKQFQGTAIYNYTEGNDERIFDGSFNFKSLDSKVIMSGSFKENQKNGTWKINLNKYPYSDLDAEYVTNLNSSGSFLNGELNGSWSAVKNTTMTLSSFSRNVYSYSKKFDPNKPMIFKENYQASFEENHFIGRFSYTRENSTDDVKQEVKGKFNVSGYCDSIWTTTYFREGMMVTEKVEYTNGLLLYRKRIDHSTGEVEIIYDNSEQVNKFIKNYNAQKSMSIVNSKVLRLEFASEYPDKDRNYESSAIKTAIGFFWSNNDKFFTFYDYASSYAYEVERGQTKIMRYPMLTLVEDYALTKELQEKQAAEERIVKKEKPFDELIEQGNEYYSKNNLQMAKEKYEAAIQYNETSGINKSIDSLQFRIRQIKQKKDAEYSSYISIYEENFKLKNYNLCLSNLKQAQKIKDDSNVQNLIIKVRAIIAAENVKEADSLMYKKNFESALLSLIKAEEYMARNEGKKRFVLELLDLKKTVYNNQYNTIAYKLNEDKIAGENYKAMLQEVENIQDIYVYKSKLKCLIQINDDIYNRLDNDMKGIKKDLQKREKYMKRICAD